MVSLRMSYAAPVEGGGPSKAIVRCYLGLLEHSIGVWSFAANSRVALSIPSLRKRRGWRISLPSAVHLPAIHV